MERAGGRHSMHAWFVTSCTCTTPYVLKYSSSCTSRLFIARPYPSLLLETTRTRTPFSHHQAGRAQTCTNIRTYVPTNGQTTSLFRRITSVGPELTSDFGLDIPQITFWTYLNMYGELTGITMDLTNWNTADLLEYYRKLLAASALPPPPPLDEAPCSSC
jgi:hypothetical protein